MKHSPRNQVVLVTGSSSGIGKACCERLAGWAGAKVYGASRKGTASDRWTYLRMNVTDDASVADGVAEVVRREGRLDAIVHCAGSSLAGPIEDTTIDEAQAQLDINFFGAVRMLRAALPVMRQQSSGKIVLIGSIGGLIGLPFLAHYSASKFALDGLVEALRAEILPFGVQACVVHPGDFNTELGTNRISCAGTQASSPYFERFQKAVAFYLAAERNGGEPDVVARRVESLLARRRLPARAVVGNPLEVAGVWAKALLPSRGFEYVFRKAHSP
jgi:NAD(P)-dependent dehydrogenase (short-subunit alcohol dehydrogenase family)